MGKDAIAAELEYRIAVDRRHFAGQLPERVAIAWRGYCAGLLEWGVIDVKHHDRLLQSLPDIENDPVRDILLGREDSSD